MKVVKGSRDTTESLAGLRVVLVDDDLSLCRAVGRVLRELGCTVTCFTSAIEAASASELAEADCLVLDLAMPEMSGLDLQNKIQSRGVDVPTLFLSGQGDIPATVTAMRNGALDFLEKPVEATTLREAIAAAAKRGALQRAQRDKYKATRERFESLTDRQREVFQGVVAGQPNKVIAHEMGITIRTVKAHRKEVMDKLDVHSVAELAFVARDLGL